MLEYIPVGTRQTSVNYADKKGNLESRQASTTFLFFFQRNCWMIAHSRKVSLGHLFPEAYIQIFLILIVFVTNSH